MHSSDANDASRALAFPLTSPSSLAVLAEASLSLPALEFRLIRREVGRLGEEGSGNSCESDWERGELPERPRSAAEIEAGRRSAEREVEGAELSSSAVSDRGRVLFLGGVNRLSLASLFGGRSGRPSLVTAPPISASTPSLDLTVLLALLAPSLAVWGGLGSWPKPRAKAPPIPSPKPSGSRRVLLVLLRLVLLLSPTLEVFPGAEA